MTTARFTVHAGLDAFLPRQRRGVTFEAQCARAATLKNAIEALGIPHTEVAAARVNAIPATLDRIVRDHDSIEVLGWTDTGTVQPAASLDFIADAHLGALARYLRMLGFDTLHEQSVSDAEIRRLAAEEHRIALTRDRELLKCRDILMGAYVRAIEPEAQLREVAARFGLVQHARPFTRCLRCNTGLVRAAEEDVIGVLPESVARDQTDFYRCQSCARVYWPGSHYARMQAALDRILA